MRILRLMIYLQYKPVILICLKMHSYCQKKKKKKPTNFHLHSSEKADCFTGRASSPRENTKYRSHNESLNLDIFS